MNNVLLDTVKHREMTSPLTDALSGRRAPDASPSRAPRPRLVLGLASVGALQVISPRTLKGFLRNCGASR
ncbi:hypothetical protein EYF80_063682 [Liparis tanakae]|uniref:Uncharacterized protein n=1 Tax=Liparis tanakae TaxID=230148 RepID=A0A4Z2EBQ2_9TELE|nr:hypothetical protein EYF80_063682 [Liparis tanakae]